MPLFRSVKPKINQVSTVSQGQEEGIDLLAQMAQYAPELFQSLGFDPTRTQEAFQQNVAQPAIQQFQEEIAPQIQSRFIGSGSARGSAGPRALATAGGRLEQGLSGQLAEMMRLGEQSGQQNQLQALIQMLGLGLGTKTFENVQTPGQQSTLGTLAPYALLSAGSGGGGFLGGRAAAGNALAQKIFG